LLCVVASLIRRISFENGDYFGKPILGEMRLCSRFMEKFSDRVLDCLDQPGILRAYKPCLVWLAYL
jgi:hypothetical protein